MGQADQFNRRPDLVEKCTGDSLSCARLAPKTRPSGATCHERNQRKDGERSAHAFTLEVGAVVLSFRPQTESRQQSGHDDDREDREIDQAGFGHVHTPFHGLEADVLQSIGGLAVEPGGRSIVATPSREVALGDPRRSAMTR